LSSPTIESNTNSINFKITKKSFAKPLKFDLQRIKNASLDGTSEQNKKNTFELPICCFLNNFN